MADEPIRDWDEYIAFADNCSLTELVRDLKSGMRRYSRFAATGPAVMAAVQVQKLLSIAGDLRAFMRAARTREREVANGRDVESIKCESKDPRLRIANKIKRERRAERKAVR